jgi:hypothetical protein
LKARRHGAQGFKHWSCLGLGAAPLRLSRRKPQQKARGRKPPHLPDLRAERGAGANCLQIERKQRRRFEAFVVPMFAPDESDPANAEGNGYANNYLLSVGHRRAVCGADVHACT